MAVALPTTQAQYQAYLDAQNKYQKQQTGGASFLQALQTALAGADQQNTALRQQQQSLIQQQYETPTKYREELIGEGITDPYKRQALLDQKLGNVASNLTGVQGKLSDLGGQRQQALDSASKAYDAETQAALQQMNNAGSFFQTLLGQDFTKQNTASQQKFEAQQNELNRQNAIRQAQIAHSGSESGGLTLAQLLGLQKDNPLALAKTKGYTRELAPNGGKGYWFYKNNADGTKTPVTVDEVANAIGGNKAALLADSSNPADQKFIQGLSGKAPTQTAKLADNNAQSGLRSLDTIESLYNSKNRKSTLSASRLPFGAGNADAQKYNAARKELTDIIARLRTGAVINDQEEKLYKTYVPGPTDTEANARYKLGQLRQFLSGLTLNGSAPTADISVDFPGYQP